MIVRNKLSLRPVLFAALIFACSQSWSATTDGSVDPSIQKLVDTYFGSWSKADFATYRSLFRSWASVTLLDREGWRQWELSKFLDDQERIQSQQRKTEVPVAIKVKALENKSAFVEVSWRLDGAPGQSATGKDWFVLLRDSGDWQIGNLTFWEDSQPRNFGRADPPAAGSTASPPKIIVSGFEGFAGRSVNASSDLARAIVKSFPQWDLTFVQVPVVWGAPKEAISHAHLTQPTIWIAFGEGTDVFQVESLAHNARGSYPDNKKQVPAQKEIDPGGAQELEVNFSVETLSNRLRDLGYDCKSSSDAGRYLCEEMLYSLLEARNSAHSNLKQAIFIHVPVEGSNVRIRGRDVPFDGDNIRTAAHDIFEAIATVLKISPAK